MNNQDNQREATLYAYMAGFLDGEGTIRISKSQKQSKKWNPSYNAGISVVNTNWEVIKLFKDVFEHSAGKERKECRSGYKVVYRWGMSGNKGIVEILQKLYPYLIVKKPQAKLVLEFIERKNTSGFKWGKKRTDLKLPDSELQLREEFYQKVKKLNAIGAPATTNQKDTREGEVIV